MTNKIIFPVLALFGCLLCLGVMGYSVPEIARNTSSMSSPFSIISPPISKTSDFIYQSIIAALTGAVLTGGSFFFLLRRMVVQYDARHEKNELELKSLEDKLHSAEAELLSKLYEQYEDLNRELRNNLTSTTKLIIDNLNSLRETIHDLVYDVSAMKGEHSKCDYRAGDVKLLQSRLDNIIQKLDELS